MLQARDRAVDRGRRTSEDELFSILRVLTASEPLLT